MIRFVASSPYCWGDGEFAPNFAKNVMMPSFGASSWPNDPICENVKIFFRKRDNCPTFWWKLCNSLFTHCGGIVADSLCRFYLRALLSLCYHLPDGASTKWTWCCYGEWSNSSHLVHRFSTFVMLWTPQKFQARVADPAAQGAPASTFRNPGWARTCLIKTTYPNDLNSTKC